MRYNILILLKSAISPRAGARKVTCLLMVPGTSGVQRMVERERIIERHYYQPAPVYIGPRAYYAPPVYQETYYARPYRHLYVYAGFRRPHFFGGYHRWHGITTTAVDNRSQRPPSPF